MSVRVQSTRQAVSSFFVGLVAPSILALSFVKSRSWRQRHIILTLFFVFAGSVATLGPNSDGFRHLLLVEHYYVHMSGGQFLHELWQVLTFQVTESGAKDVYKHVLSWVLGRVLGAPGLFFPIVAGVYGYFFVGSALHVLRQFRPSKANYVVLMFVVVFLLIKGFIGFYTVRTWTGLWILVYACLKYHERRQRKYLLLMFVPPLVHLGFFIMAVPAWLVLVFGARPGLYAGIFVASSVTTLLPVADVTKALSQTERGAHEVRAYQVEEQVDALDKLAVQQQSTNFYNAYRRAGVQRWATAVFIYILLLSGVYLARMRSYHRTIFSIGLLTMALSNATWFLYALHKRSLTLATVFLLASFLMSRLDPASRHVYRGLPPYYPVGLLVSFALFFPLMLFNLSVTFDVMSVFLIGAPFVAWIDPGLNLSIKEVLKLLL